MDILSAPGALPVNELLCDLITSCGELCARGSAGQHHGSPLAAQPRAHAPHEARRRRQSCSLRAPRGPIPAQVTETLLLLCINNHGPASQGGPTAALETLVYGVRLARGASEIGLASRVCHVRGVQARSKPAPVLIRRDQCAPGVTNDGRSCAKIFTPIAPTRPASAPGLTGTAAGWCRLVFRAGLRVVASQSVSPTYRVRVEQKKTRGGAYGCPRRDRATDRRGVRVGRGSTHLYLSALLASCDEAI